MNKTSLHEYDQIRRELSVVTSLEALSEYITSCDSRLWDTHHYNLANLVISQTLTHVSNESDLVVSVEGLGDWIKKIKGNVSEPQVSESNKLERRIDSLRDYFANNEFITGEYTGKGFLLAGKSITNKRLVDELNKTYEFYNTNIGHKEMVRRMPTIRKLSILMSKLYVRYEDLAEGNKLFIGGKAFPKKIGESEYGDYYGDIDLVNTLEYFLFRAKPGKGISFISKKKGTIEIPEVTMSVTSSDVTGLMSWLDKWVKFSHDFAIASKGRSKISPVLNHLFNDIYMAKADLDLLAKSIVIVLESLRN